MKFSALRTLATLLRVVAVLEGLAGMALAIAAMNAKDSSTLVFLVATGSVAFKVLVTYAVAEAIGVFLAIEENTRRAPNGATSKAAPSAVDEDEKPRAAKAKSYVSCKHCGEKTEADSQFCQKCGIPTAKD